MRVFSEYLCIVAVTPVKDQRCKLEVVLEGDLLAVAPERGLLLLNGVIVECECERRHLGLIMQSTMGLMAELKGE